jgi:hypothetical protein
VKNIVICIALLMLSTISYSQQTSPTATFTKVDYLQKSKNQKTTGLILAGGGVVLEIAGIIAYQYSNASIFFWHRLAFTSSQHSLSYFCQGK